MARRVVSLLRASGGVLWGTEPALEANAYAVAADVELSLLLRGSGVELAVAAAHSSPGEVAGAALPPAASAQELRGLIESGVAVFVDSVDLDHRGLAAAELVDGARLIDRDQVAAVLGGADAVIAW
jgi:sulfur relay (sulfurtransferase) DsrF/TusC family protein